MSVISTIVGRGRAGRALAAAAGGLAMCGMLAAGSGGPAAPAAAPGGVVQAARLTSAAGTGLRPACPAPGPRRFRCFVLWQPQTAVNRALAAGRAAQPSGWTPAVLQRAYRLPVGRQSHATIAVSIAGRTPHLGNYLRTYRARFGLPPCGQPSGCLRIVNQHGKASPPAPSSLGSGWDVEATLDVSMISAACPHCKILVVEGNSPDVRDLAATENTAARLGARVISNSYGIRENALFQGLARDYRHPGHMVVVASGDLGFDAADFPANLQSVTAVGGTSLRRAHNRRGFTERVWDDPSIFGASSSGCSAYVPKPAWQHSPHCPGRTIADVSAIASTIPIYNKAWGGWLTVAGTSAAAPFIAGVYGLAGNAAHIAVAHLYRHAAGLFDITRGNNALQGGSPRVVCGNDYLCVAKKGYDAPTGLGTPDGTGAF
jgi:hypothetical protein